MGNFHHWTESEGVTVDLRAEVTCVGIDPVLRRAWIGGVITENRSTDPDHQLTIHQPGQDIWFRMQDNGEGPDVPDRVTFTGFKGSGGVITSAEYCERKLWLNEGQPVTTSSPGSSVA